MQSRIIPKPNGGMARGDKRGLDTNSEDGAPDRKRPALASVIVEALKVDSLQKLCSSLEPVLRRVVSEEVERALAKLGTAKLSGRPSPKRIEATDGKNLQLQFRTKLSLPLFTGGKVEGEQNATIHVVLIDANTGQIITTGPESSAKLDIVVLEGDFNNEEEEGWTGEEFDSHVVKEREGKRPLLTGELQVTLKEGVGILGDLTFTDNSSWIRSRKFRLGLKVSPGCCEDIRIREAKTDAFTVKDHRGELYKKHYPPALQDEVWRLEKIGKDGSFHKRLNKAGIYSVEDFLRLVVRDSQRLRNILGSGMSNKMWDILVEHAKTCVLSGNHYIYYSDDPRNFGVVFNNIYELTGLIAGEQYHPADTLSDSQKVFVDSLVKKAYENWMHVIEYDGKSLLSFTQNKGSAAPQSDSMIVSQSNSATYDYQMNLPSLPPSVPQEQPSISPGQANGGYENAASRFPLQSHGMNVNSSIHINSSSLPIHNHNHLLSASSQVQSPMNANLLAIGQSQPSLSNFHAGSSSSITSYRGFEDVVPEEDIRLRSHEMLENEDMQQLLRMFNMGGSYGPNSQQVPMNVTENNYHYNLGYMPNASANYGFEEDRTRSSGKAVVGWLKLKAALRWGIFVRKKAAERRAQIVDLDES